MERRLNHGNGARRTTAATLSPLLGLSGALGGARMTARRSWSPQHQSSLEVPAPRQIQSARNSLAAASVTGVRQQNSIEVAPVFTTTSRLENVALLSSSSYSPQKEKKFAYTCPRSFLILLPPTSVRIDALPARDPVVSRCVCARVTPLATLPALVISNMA